MVLAKGGWPEISSCLACLASLFLAAAGSAMINGLLDAGPDRQMIRLRARVAALDKAGAGRVLGVALTGLAASTLLAFLYLNPLALALILTAALSYGLLYTLGLKRRSPWGAVVGGIPGALPVLVGYATVAHCVRLDGLILFVVMLLWQPPHFWALALEHQNDYRAAAIPVLPLTHGRRFTTTIILIFVLSLIPASLSLWLTGFCSAFYAFAALADGIAFLSACYLFIVRKERFILAFNASIVYLTFLFAAIVADICLFHGGAS